MKSAGNALLKRALSALCRTLPGAGWSPEMFRKAKYNRPEAAPEFWKLLYWLLKPTCPGENQSSFMSKNESLEYQTKYVKGALRCQGYGRRAFFHLPGDGTEGSRELLVVFSWLLRKSTLLEKFLEISRFRSGDEMDGCTCVQELRFKENEDTTPFPNRNVDVRYVQWLNGKLRLCRKSLQAAEQEKYAVLHKISSYTTGGHFDQKLTHLSSVEVGLVRHPENAGKVLQSLASENSRLEAYLEWKEVEAVFWLWMESILVSGCDDEQITPSGNTSSMTTWSCHCSSALHEDIEETDRCLTELQARLVGEVACKQSAWQEQIKEIRKRLDKKQADLMEKMNKREAQKKAQELAQTSRSKETRCPFRLIFKDCLKTEKCSFHKDPADLHVAELISRLRQAEAELEAEIHVLQEECRRRLDDMIEQYDGVICIPPFKELMRV